MSPKLSTATLEKRHRARLEDLRRSCENLRNRARHDKFGPPAPE